MVHGGNPYGDFIFLMLSGSKYSVAFVDIFSAHFNQVGPIFGFIDCSGVTDHRRVD